MTNETWVLLACILLCLISIYEFLRYKYPAVLEGFTGSSTGENKNYFSKFFMRRYDVVPGQKMEDFGFIRDPRYVESYADVQGIGTKNDFCRMVKKPDGDEKSLMVACALGGTEGLDPYVFKSKTVGQGFLISRDDYFNDGNGDGRDDYCRILKLGPDRFEAQCAIATIEGFSHLNVQDSKPPADIKDLLWFFEGIMVWYRFFDDMVDYADNARLSRYGKIEIDEDPKKGKTQGLELNRIDSSAVEKGAPIIGSAPPAEQFVRLGESSELEFGKNIKLRNMRAISCWVYWDAFTNNSKIFDFGNGAGQDNIFLGIDGKGDADPKQMEFNAARPSDTDKICNSKASKEVSPQRFLRITDANVDEWECEGPSPVDSVLEDKDFSVPQDNEITATLLFEIWDDRQRKMRIKIPKAFRLRKWQHIVITTTDNESFRPTWEVYIDGKIIYREEDGHMAQTNFTSMNYIGKSNWENLDTQYANKDERFRGSLFDFRMYKTPMSTAKIEKTIQYGKSRLFMDE